MFSIARAILTSRPLFLARNPSVPPLLAPLLAKRTMSSTVAKRLEGKTIVITGASSGIGRSCAFEFARTQPHNLRLILIARRIDSLREVAAKIRESIGTGVKVLPFQLDVSNPDEVRSFVGNLPEEWRDIDVLVNNAFVSPFSHSSEPKLTASLQGLGQGRYVASRICFSTSLAHMTLAVAKAPEIAEEDIEVMFRTNVTGLINMTQAILPIFKTRPDGGAGDIINIGSIAGREPYPGGSIYCATKAAVRSFTESLRKEHIATRIRIMEVDPGQVETVSLPLSRL